MRPTPEYTERFRVDRAGNLVRAVEPKRGKSYEHRTSREAFERVAWAADEIGADGITQDKLVQRTGLPSTQVSVALAFMKDRGCILTKHRINFPAPGNKGQGRLYSDAMIEFEALADKGPADPAFGYETPGPEPAEG
jgi:hypothetical protein